LLALNSLLDLTTERFEPLDDLRQRNCQLGKFPAVFLKPLSLEFIDTALLPFGSDCRSRRDETSDPRDAAKRRQEKASVSTLPLTAQMAIEFVADFTFKVSRTDSDNFFACHQNLHVELPRESSPVDRAGDRPL
jgi:hypothetical protein